MNAPRAVTRRFPDYGWSWPQGDLHLLLQAVLHEDDDIALAAGLEWLATHDIDAISFREQRLLTALSGRFGKKLAVSPAHPRLVGLQRLLWTKSRLALREASRALETLADAGISLMLLKGASRVALDPTAQRSRISHDVDILVRTEEIEKAFAIMLENGWNAASGAGPLRLLGRARTYRAMNFFKGDFGDIDVHQFAYPLTHGHAQDEDRLWERSLPGTLEGISVRVPAASDRIALAIAHGALDAHTHSDWLVDVDRILRSEEVDWNALLHSVRDRRVTVPTAAALSYLVTEIGTPVPRHAYTRFVQTADRQGVSAKLALLECKPRTDFNTPIAMARGLVKQFRLWKSRHALARAPEAIQRPHLARPVFKREAGTSLGEKALVEGFRYSEISFEITLRVDMPKPRRRIDWELTTPDRHICVLRHRKLLPYAGLQDLIFRIPALSDLEGRVLHVTARPSRLLRATADRQEREKHGPVSFRILGIKPVDLASGKPSC